MKIQSNFSSYNSYQRNNNPNFKAQLVPKHFPKVENELMLLACKPDSQFRLLKNAVEDSLGCNHPYISSKIERFLGKNFSNLILKPTEAQELEKLRNNPRRFSARVRQICTIEKRKYEAKPDRMTEQYPTMVREFNKMNETLKIEMYDENVGERLTVRPFTEEEIEAQVREEEKRIEDIAIFKEMDKLKKQIKGEKRANKGETTSPPVETELRPIETINLNDLYTQQELDQWNEVGHVKYVYKPGAIDFEDLLKKKDSAKAKLTSMILNLLYSDELTKVYLELQRELQKSKLCSSATVPSGSHSEYSLVS